MDKKADVSYPKVSVIIPAYNRESFIRETVDSVLEQTYPNIELIVVDDGSTDNTLKILKEFGKKLVLLQHLNGENKGQSAAINLGIKVSSGEYIAILDSDDLFAPLKIELQVNFLEKNYEIGLVYANGIAINDFGEKLYKLFPLDHKEGNDPSRMLLECHFNIPSNSLMRKSIFQLTGLFEEKFRSAQDHDMGIKIMENTIVAYMNEPLWFYRKHENTLSSKFAYRRWKTGFKILENACNRFNYGKKVKHKRLAVLNFRVGQCFLEDGKYLLAVFHFVKACFYDPKRSVSVFINRGKITGPH